MVAAAWRRIGRFLPGQRARDAAREDARGAWRRARIAEWGAYDRHYHAALVDFPGGCPYCRLIRETWPDTARELGYA